MTRFDLRNLGLQCKKRNRFEGGRSYEFGVKLDEIWGRGTAALMQKLSRQVKNWINDRLQQLTSAAKIAWLPYPQLCTEIAP